VAAGDGSLIGRQSGAARPDTLGDPPASAVAPQNTLRHNGNQYGPCGQISTTERYTAVDDAEIRAAMVAAVGGES